jgi:uncharacterized repeat protein (TIGR03803 family)
MKAVSIALIAGVIGWALDRPVSAADAATYSEKVVYSFCPTANSCPDGASPQASLINVNGTLYGTAYNGDGYGSATVFALAPDTGEETVLVAFGGYTPGGQNPQAGLIDVKRTLYGTTSTGGSGNFGADGTVFAFDLNTNTYTVVYSFCSQQNCADGADPGIGNLIEANGTLYGTTFAGGKFGEGAIFSVDLKTGAETALYSFHGLRDGIGPYAGRIDVHGTLYGTTYNGGAAGSGTVFSVDLNTGAKTVVHSFGSGSDGATPVAGLMDVKGTLYGTTSAGGPYEAGTVFALMKNR